MSITTWTFRSEYSSDPGGAAARFLGSARTLAAEVGSKYRLPIDDAEDFCQEAFVRAVSRDGAALGRTDCETDLTAWIRGVIENLAKSRIRDHIRSRRGGRPQDLSLLSDRRDARAVLRRARLRSLVGGYEGRLTPSERIPFTMFLAGLEYSTIGKRLGVRWETVRERIERAWRVLDRSSVSVL